MEVICPSGSEVGAPELPLEAREEIIPINIVTKIDTKDGRVCLASLRANAGKESILTHSPFRYDPQRFGVCEEFEALLLLNPPDILVCTQNRNVISNFPKNFIGDSKRRKDSKGCRGLLNDFVLNDRSGLL